MHPIDVDTPHGIAAAHLSLVEAPRGAVVLGHGAGGGIGAPDLVAVAAVAHDAGFTVALVEQPYRVAGRRSPPRAPALDAAWTAVVERLRRDHLAGLPIVVGGRSSGARVACRTAALTGAAGVLCLAFPLQPPRRTGRAEAPSRLPELDGVDVPVLVLQGERDPFGRPPTAVGRSVVVVPGDHALRTTSSSQAIAAATLAWLEEVVAIERG